jgi:hypothetical protein
MMVALDPRTDYDPADPLVRDYAWAFVEIEGGHAIRESVSVEQATAAPGEKRSRSK